jgi:ubiquitin C-terminal hydrolase
LIEDEYNPKATEILRHSSTAINDEKSDEDVNLEDCLRKFHEVEDLGANDNIFCT